MLKRLPVLFLVASMVAGCGKGSSTSPSAPETTRDSKAKGSAKTTKPEIELKVLPLEVEKGKSAKYTVGVDRTKFDGEVQVAFEPFDASGFKIDAATIPAGKDSVEVTVTADPKAGAGKLKITGTGKGVEPYEVYIAVQVK